MFDLLKARVDQIGARVIAWALRSEDDTTPAETLFWALAGSGMSPLREFRDEPADHNPDRLERILRIRVVSTSRQHLICYDYDVTGRWLHAVRVLPPEALD